MGDQEELLRDGVLRALADVEGEAEHGEDDAGLLPPWGTSRPSAGASPSTSMEVWKREGEEGRGGRRLRRGLANLGHSNAALRGGLLDYPHRHPLPIPSVRT